jgi:deoxyribose-phosphate aldolase
MSGGSEAITVARRALVCLDLTDLDPDSDAEAIDDLCTRAQTPHGFVAAVCVWPRLADRAAEALNRTGIKVATVVNFPGGDGAPADAAAEAEEALANGADEIDVVVPYRRLSAGEPEAVTELVAAVRKASGHATLKAILETGALTDAGEIALASERALEGGADFLKTSTGKIAAGAAPDAAETILETIRRLGSGAGLKVSGGVRTVADAGTYLDLADRVMGTGWAGPKHFRIGASGLLSALLAELEGTDPEPGDDDY